MKFPCSVYFSEMEKYEVEALVVYISLRQRNMRCEPLFISKIEMRRHVESVDV